MRNLEDLASVKDYMVLKYKQQIPTHSEGFQ